METNYVEQCPSAPSLVLYSIRCDNILAIRNARNAPKQDGEPLASDKYSKPRLSFLFHFQDKKREEREKRKNRLSSSHLNRLKEK
ncbi:hypothetical protein MRB53_012413 [Persea americana]|uniref:Uncharacterized protein n=1 Tax=Persea americana TaxID=3435 RepID=A0ACC2LXP3_PERAE|nr:hypothetical protein MRB53_012413 [Persea americana]